MEAIKISSVENKQTSRTAPDEYFNTRRKALFASPLDDCLTA
jgi:hypothetical protein